MSDQEYQYDEFATVEAWERDDQRELSLLFNHQPHDRAQFNRSQMRSAIRHGMRLARINMGKPSEQEIEAMKDAVLAEHITAYRASLTGIFTEKQATTKQGDEA